MGVDMISGQVIKQCLSQLGYSTDDIYADYQFAAVDIPQREVRSVHMAAFLEGPASYKTAALAVVRSDSADLPSEIQARRSLGAPYLIVLGKETASAWTFAIDGPSKIEETSIESWEILLQNQKALFSPDSIRQLKYVRLRDKPHSLSLFDPATLRDIQADTQFAVHELLQAFLKKFEDKSPKHLLLERDYRTLFPMIFRLLTAKILIDREDKIFIEIDTLNVKKTLAAIEELYALVPLQVRWNSVRHSQVSDAWDSLRSGLYVRNVAAEDLAFIYEHTLITPKIRQDYGTHSTPPSVADYVIRSFNFPADGEAQKLSVYEPFAGSCVFLTAALRRFKELLPSEWTPKQTHDHLVKHFKASEIDSFACEIARLSLILADYPHHNGWHIENEDLFADKVLYKRTKAANVVICNPPFEDFTKTVPGHSIHKPIAVLETILQAHPDYFGIVMPNGLSTHKKYEGILASVTKLYGDVELLKLPEGIFRHAQIGTEVLIAQQPRRVDINIPFTQIKGSEVSKSEFYTFEHTLRPTKSETVTIDPIKAPGLIGLRPLRNLWEELAYYKTLGSVAEIHRGLEWNYDQAHVSRPTKAVGFCAGLHRFSDGVLAQYRVTSTAYLDCRENKLRGGAIKNSWDQPKVICNAIRSSRGPWRLAAAVDLHGLMVSQQFFGIWLKDQKEAPAPQLDLWEVAAILNSPLANAYSFCHDNHKGLRVKSMKDIPLPRRALATSFMELVNEYISNVCDVDDGPLFNRKTRSEVSILMELDALILAAYDLPPTLEKELLRFMKDGDRPCQHDFPNYPGICSPGALPLAARLSIDKSDRTRAWNALRKPLPSDISDVFEFV